MRPSLIYHIWPFLIAFILVSALLVATQRQYIYFPRKYPPDIHQQLKQVTTIDYQINKSPQQAYFFSKSKNPDSMWIMLGGNASLSLQWLPLVEKISSNSTGFLLIDYPGYGNNKGYPGQTNNLLTVLEAYKALKKQFPNDHNLYILGHSLGSAVAIETAEKLPPKALILLSPFTSIYAMSKRVIGSTWAWLLRPFLWDRYRSDEKLSNFHQTHPETPIFILHGNKDTIVPINMAKTLANNSPRIHFRILKEVGHNLPYEAEESIIHTMYEAMSVNKI